ncbi:putative DNA-binding domain-containing protein [Duganella sp. FT3S]|uniref:Putative DNA-binding domain-containing protein n=1 Tax=Rugamonas fusca TaxID=2758568 RepID=A0A7W2I5E9_9BURK|nr:DNA-binding domain-containing protein [Rugamonas fusca]MBA5604205.1 putative DNA-binding domain-containing protein [Rugamonas fusca]
MSNLDEFFDALRDPEKGAPSDLVTWNGSDPGARFAVHRNNIAVSLVDALADTFPVCLALVGQQFFRPMAHAFVRNHPPKSPVLAWYGDAFPDFVSHFLAAASVPYLADVARLEWAWVRAYHAADDDTLDARAPGALLENPDLLPGLRMRFHPSVQVVSSQYAIVSIWGAHQGWRNLDAVNPYLPEAALVARPGIEVTCIPISAAQATLFQALQSGAPLGPAIETTLEQYAELDLPRALGILFSHTIISSVTTIQRKEP